MNIGFPFNLPRDFPFCRASHFLVVVVYFLGTHTTIEAALFSETISERWRSFS